MQTNGCILPLCRCDVCQCRMADIKRKMQETQRVSTELQLSDSVPANDTVITHAFPSLWSRAYQSLFMQLSLYWQAGGTNWLLGFIGLRRVEG